MNAYPTLEHCCTAPMVHIYPVWDILLPLAYTPGKKNLWFLVSTKDPYFQCLSHTPGARAVSQLYPMFTKYLGWLQAWGTNPVPPSHKASTLQPLTHRASTPPFIHLRSTVFVTITYQKLHLQDTVLCHIVTMVSHIPPMMQWVSHS